MSDCNKLNCKLPDGHIHIYSEVGEINEEKREALEQTGYWKDDEREYWFTQCKHGARGYCDDCEFGLTPCIVRGIKPAFVFDMEHNRMLSQDEISKLNLDDSHGRDRAPNKAETPG